MNILVIGDPVNLEECKLKFGDQHAYTFEQDHREAERFVAGSDLVFDFIVDEEPFQVEIYAEKEGAKVFLNTAKISLAELSNLAGHNLKAHVFGFNGLPTFLLRDTLEISLLKESDKEELATICSALTTNYLVVDDRVGLVTPRIVSMIINEAYYTVQEGTATREDIDQAMKLGTNYPYGPFEWCNRIGVKHVYELLEAVYEDTHDERYKICPLLKKEYLKL
ncbi:MAG TPA: 3-hydroxyacyl-CoA dehydrogenase family protein [Cyclobacteriaceae bacterium]|nr:3-hydroxyacyl-CoA dehydrogenase family protein [Cyclobacteriaceae bacterium]HRJ82677.1 3-hydroxyacyl-CoA dehydrogenase family protein [Cyclobacteriaceae bacterium]